MEAVGGHKKGFKLLRSNSEAVTQKASKRGFNLIEAAIVLAVVGGVIGTIWTASAKLHQERQLNQAVSDMLIVSNNIRRIYKGFDLSGYIRLDTKAAYDAGIFEGSSIKVNNYNAPSDQLNNIRADYLTGYSLRINNYFIVFDFTTNTTEQCIKIGSFVSSRLKNDTSLFEISSGSLHRVFPFIPTASECETTTIYMGDPHSLHFFFNF